MAAKTYAFRAQVEAWAEKAKRNLKAVAVETFQDIAEEVVTQWPVKTGFSRASWFAQVNTMPTGKAGTAGGAEYAAVAANFTLGDTLYFGNTAAYARRLELGFVGEDSLGRKYDQPGRYVVRGVMDRAQTIANAAAQRIAAGDAGGANPGGGGAGPGKGFV